jgi:hypothetical protein
MQAATEVRDTFDEFLQRDLDKARVICFDALTCLAVNEMSRYCGRILRRNEHVAAA